MNTALVGLYGLYLVFVGIAGNAGKLKTAVESDAKGFIPFVLAILILKAMYQSQTLRPAVKPFIGLAVLTFTLKNYGKIITQVNAISGLNLAGGTNGQNSV